MRLIVIGCEYTGKSTLIDAIMAWGACHGIHHHLDDHFSIPDQQFLSPEERQAMVAIPPMIKERFQRFQIYYHVHVIAEYGDCLLGGLHIEEAIYGPRYYYPEHVFPLPYARRFETYLPEDTILLMLGARPDVIRARMRAAPHAYSLVPPADVEAVSAEFVEQHRSSWIRRKFAIDTSDLTPDQLFATFRQRVRPFLSERDLLRWPADA